MALPNASEGRSVNTVRHDSGHWGFRSDIKVIMVHLSFWKALKTAAVQKWIFIRKAAECTGKSVRVSIRHLWARISSL